MVAGVGAGLSVVVAGVTKVLVFQLLLALRGGVEAALAVWLAGATGVADVAELREGLAAWLPLESEVDLLIVMLQRLRRFKRRSGQGNNRLGF